MSQEPSQVVFPLHANTESCIFTYQAVSLKAPRKRGRPKGRPKNGKANHSQDECGDADPQDFDFVNYTGNVSSPSHALQKLIRRRGMLQFFRAKRQNQATRRRSLEAPTTPLICQPNSVDPFDATPLQMDPYAHDLLKHCCTSIWRRLYLIEQKAEFNPIAEFWMPLAFQDRALLHALIAFSGFYTFWNTSIEDQPFIFNHLKKAIAQANERMADRTKAVSTETLVVVALVAIIQSLHGIGENWGHTMEGLRMLIDNQGGLGSLEQKPMVLGAIYRADLSGSVDLVRRPFLAAKHFTWPGTWDCSPLRSGFTHLQKIMDMHERLKICIGSLDDTIASLKQLGFSARARVRNNTPEALLE